MEHQKNKKPTSLSKKISTDLPPSTKEEMDRFMAEGIRKELDLKKQKLSKDSHTPNK